MLTTLILSISLLTAPGGPLPGEPVLYNWPFGMFTRSNLKEVLDNLGVDTLVLVGVATDMAVLSAVFQASDMLYSLIVPDDASTSVLKSR